MNIRPASEFLSGEPGLYEGVEDSVYHGFDACSNSRFSKLFLSPAHLKYDIDVGFKDTPAKKFGRALHKLILEPLDFAARYDIAKTCGGKIKSGDRKGEQCTSTGSVRISGVWYCGTHKPKPVGGADLVFDSVEVLSGDDHQTLQTMKTALRKNVAVERIFSFGGGRELSALWIHAETGLLMKCRIDFYAPDVGLLIDYKTTKSLSKDFGLTHEHVVWENEDASAFVSKKLDVVISWAVYNYGYHRQAALYLMAMAALGLKLEDFLIIAQEKEPPHMAVTFRVRDDALKAGRTQLAPLFETYARCKKTNRWPGYANDQVLSLDLPEGAYNKIYDEELEV